MKSPKVAVILFNLGGPDRPESIYPFLKNFFMDRNILRVPYPVRWFLSRRIAAKRSGNEAGKSYALLGGASPLLANSKAQADALEKKLESPSSGAEFKTFVCMRYWHPMADEVAQDVKAFMPDKVVLLPLYPQFSTTTTRSSFQSWKAATKKAGIDQIPTSGLCCYPVSKGFVRASARLVKTLYEKALGENEGQHRPRVLFSAHGLPEKIIRDGDPYQRQCEESARAIVQEMGIEGLDWEICYQSRVGPLKWIGPSTEHALEKAGKDNVPVVIYPHAFVNEHVETLVEIELEYREFAEEHGVPGFYRVPTVSESEDFISDLADLVLQKVKEDTVSPPSGHRECAAEFRRCWMSCDIFAKKCAA